MLRRAMETIANLFSSRPIWTVGELTRHIRQVLESDYRLQDMWVGGEVSNVSRPSSGHLYFTLRDESASLRCVMWRPRVAHQTHLPRDGEMLEVLGHISVYDAGGQYQLYAESLRPAGEGARFAEFLELKARLEAEGLFDPERKQPLPEWPNTIGVVTSPSGAALRDVVNVLRRRFPLVTLLLSPTQVQGDDAPAGIVNALESLNQDGRADVLLLIRGGGSMEDLWTFNHEDVVRAIAHSIVPIVTGIGHETDVILADFAADLRAPTPSAAAEVATPDRSILREDLAFQYSDLNRLFREQLHLLLQSLEMWSTRLKLASPRAHVASKQQRLDEFIYRAGNAIQHRMALSRAAITGLQSNLHAVGPSTILARGYAVVTLVENGQVVRSITQVSPGDPLQIQVQDGTFVAKTQDQSGE
ncbi:MAG: exodeoxyribonuclease VII large subunit [Anaerolineales bacterium]|nr:exodeoxyribonuclease VII large subunit [Anaerolineales bacterium]